MMSTLSFEKSWALASRAEVHDAWLATRKAILPQDVFPERSYPIFVSRASGAYFWDVDDNRYIDYILGFGTVILGHADPRVTDAVIADLRTGVNVSPFWRRPQIELSETLASIIPGAEMSYAMKTGSDATTGALRLARVFTGRQKVVRWGYNGWHDWSCSRTAGISDSVLLDTLGFEYNDIGSLRSVFDAYPGEIACVIMMPFETEAPNDGFLGMVRDIAHANGALFILDEIRSGFRMALGGAQQFFDIQADLATFSKAMSNGFAISAIVGKAGIMRSLGHTHMASTYYANSAAMVAAITTIDILRNTDALKRIWQRGEELIGGLRRLIDTIGVAAEVVGYPPCPFLRFKYESPITQNEKKIRFYSETVRRGVLLHPNHHWFISAAHSAEDIELTLEACRKAFESIC